MLERDGADFRNGLCKKKKYTKVKSVTSHDRSTGQSRTKRFYDNY